MRPPRCAGGAAAPGRAHGTQGKGSVRRPGRGGGHEARRGAWGGGATAPVGAKRSHRGRCAAAVGERGCALKTASACALHVKGLAARRSGGARCAVQERGAGTDAARSLASRPRHTQLWSRRPHGMALFGCSSAARPGCSAAARELAARGAPAAASVACRPRRRDVQCRCDAGDRDDGAVAGAPAPLLTSKTAQRLKVSMMSLGCPKNVVDGAPAQRLRPPASAPAPRPPPLRPPRAGIAAL